MLTFPGDCLTASGSSPSPFLFRFVFIGIKVQLTYNVVLVSSGQQSDSVIHLYKELFISHVHLLSVTRGPNVHSVAGVSVNLVYQASCNLERFSVLQSRLRARFS